MKANLNSSLIGIAPQTSGLERSSGRRVSNLTTTARESSVQPDCRPALSTNSRQTGLPQPTPFAGRFQPPCAHRKHPGQTDRDYRRTVRAAEMSAWNAASPSDTTFLRAAAAAERSRAEELAFNAILVVALAGVAWGLVHYLLPMHAWERFGTFARQLLG